MTAANPIDLSQLPFPGVVETIDYETLYQQRKERFLARVPAELRASCEEALTLDSEPTTMLLQDNVYEVMLLRQRVNDAARALMLAFAKGADQDHLVALLGVKRLVLTPADPENNIPAVMEKDEDQRRRAQLAPLGFSVAGPEGAYKFHALSADAAVRDVAVSAPVFSKATIAPEVAALLPPRALVLVIEDDAGLPDPMPGDVAVYVLSRDGDGSASAPLLQKVQAALDAETVRPLTDQVVTQTAGIVRYQVRAKLYFLPGPDRSLSMAEARRRLDVYVEECRQFGREVALSGIMGALHVPGVERVELIEPAANIPTSDKQASYCTSIELSEG